MQLKTSITKYLGGLLLLLGSYTLVNYVAVAQPPAEPATSTPEQATDGSSDPDSTAEPVTAAPSNQPFEDYEASEQISEDLSVAFPVDI